MKKALLVFMALVVPFFSQADIFFDSGLTHMEPDKLIGYQCSGPNASISAASSPGACASWAANIFKQATPSSGTSSIRNHSGYADDLSLYIKYDLCYSENVEGVCNEWFPNQVVGTGSASPLPPVDTCPPEDGSPNTFGKKDSNDNLRCFNPDEIALVDTCNINDSPNVQVTSSNACYTKSDGSMCSVSAVDVGGGNQVYQGDEGNCYQNNNPDITGNPDLGGEPVGPDCVNNGGLLACPEDPTNVCGDTGTTYGGGSVNNCQSGCGYVNDAFICHDTDIDSDGLPDYNDPDIDGDGIKNSDDLDSDGDGKDDPINGGPDGTTSSTGGGGSIDLTPVVNELKKLNKNFDKQADFAEFGADGKLDELNNKYELDLESFIAKGSSELGYTDVLSLSNGTAAALSALPSNECQPYTIKIQNFSSTFDMCPAAAKAKPILAWLVGMLTAWHIFILVNQTLREGL